MQPQRQRTRERLLGNSAHQEKIFRYMFKRSDPQQWTRWLQAPLEHACDEGDADVVETLLEAGGDGTAKGRGEGGRTLLHAGAYGGSERVVRALLNAGAKPDIDIELPGEWPNNLSPLRLAVRRGHDAAARVLMAAGADVSGTLTIAISVGDEDLMHDLLLAGADPNGDANDFRTPLRMAAEKGLERLVRALLEKGADTRGRLPLHAAARGGHVSTAKLLISAGFGVNDFDFNGKTPLHAAVFQDGIAGSRRRAMVDFLVAAGADVNAQQLGSNKCGSPLHTAANAGHAEGVLALLQHGADVNAIVYGSGDKPLHTACSGGTKIDVVDLLLRWGADETAVNQAGKMAIDVVPTMPDTSCGFLARANPERSLLLSLLTRAPNDRAWRRRGFVVLCRAYPRRLRLKTAPRSAPACRCASTAGDNVVHKESGGVGGDALRGRRAFRGGNREVVDGSGACSFDGLAAWLMVLQEDGVFRHIVGFL